MTLKTFALAYVVGGVTFIPLLLLAVIATAWAFLPRVERKDDFLGSSSEEAIAAKELDRTHGPEQEYGQDESHFANVSGTSGTFAVLRAYDFPTASAALNARAAAAQGPGAEGPTTDVPSGSESVYQSMYRSVFDRGSKSSESSSVLSDNADNALGTDLSSKIRARYMAGNAVFYIVLRHGHLMLYTSQAQVEVKHVISLAHHHVGLTERSENSPDRQPIVESDLFVKRTAIVLTPSNTPSVRRQSAPKPFFLFSSSCSEMEDFYYALLIAQTPHSVPLQIPVDRMIKLQSVLHSSSLSSESRAINALFGRLFLSLHQTSQLRDQTKAKIERKLSRVLKPSFIETISLTNVDLGDSAPIFSNFRLNDLHISGEMVVSADVKYTGSFQITLSALAKIDLGLGQRFNPGTILVVLDGILKRLHGQVLLRIKPPPSNRIWFCFDTTPDMELKIEPVVGTRQISYGFILRAVENKIREMVTETLVKPNWDDIAFTETTGHDIRGGIWHKSSKPSTEDLQEQEPNANATRFPSDPSAYDIGKSESQPNLSSSNDAATAALKASAVDHAQPLGNLKHRSAVSLPTEAGGEEIVMPLPKHVRSPTLASLSSSAPSIAIDGASVDAVKRDDPAASSPRKWRTWAQPQVRKDAMEAVRDLQSRAAQTMINASGTSTPAFENDNELKAQTGTDNTIGAEHKEPEILADTILRAQTFPSDADTVTEGETGDKILYQGHKWPDSGTRAGDTKAQQPQQRSKALLAATAAATNAAKHWYAGRQSRTASGGPGVLGASSSTQSVAQKRVPEEPIGRGQPLPPPGVPLPGPDGRRSSWVGGAAGLMGIAGRSTKRKPVLPPRKPATPTPDTVHVSDASDAPKNVRSTDTASLPDQHAVEALEHMNTNVNVTESGDNDDFGPWSENSGLNNRETATGNLASGDGTLATMTDNSFAKRSGQEVAIEEATGKDEGDLQILPHSSADAAGHESRRERKAPPPLPKRRPRSHDSAPVDAVDKDETAVNPVHDAPIEELGSASGVHSASVRSRDDSQGHDAPKPDDLVGRRESSRSMEPSLPDDKMLNVTAPEP